MSCRRTSKIPHCSRFTQRRFTQHRQLVLQEEKVLKLETMSKAITASLNVQFMSYRQTLGLYGSVIHASSPASNIPHNNHGPHPQRSARRGSANYSRGKIMIEKYQRVVCISNLNSHVKFQNFSRFQKFQ